MTTTVRSVRVQLDAAVGGYIRDMKLAGSETDRAFSGVEARLASVDKRMSAVSKGMSGTASEARGLRTELGGVDDGLRKVDNSTRKSEASIDKYSGRLRVLTDLVLTLGPAALRLGAGSLPVLSAGVAGLGAAGGGLGVTILALHGFGDALKALDEYQADPTVENLQKLRIEQEKLGASGTQFLAYLDNLEPELKGLQQLARDGVLPGFEEGIDDLLTRLPLVRQVVNRLSQEVGTLGADAGDALASDEWTPFFEYLRATAAPTLDDFARSTGNVALGLANILVAFDPLTRDFTGGLEDMTGRFADWSKTLDDNEGFQDFLDTVREAGPEARDFAAAIIQDFAGLAHASAPVGRVVLPALTGVAKAFAAIANSPIGPTLYTAATAWTIYSRAASLAEKTTGRISTKWDGMSKAGKAGAAAAGIGLLAAALTDYDDKVGLSNTVTLGFAGSMAGPWGAAVGTGIGLLIDITQANDDLAEATTRANEALRSGDTSQMRDQLQALRDEITETDKAAHVGVGEHLGVSGSIDALGSMWSKFTGEEDKAKDAASDLDSAIHSNVSRLSTLRPVLGGAADDLIDAAEGAEQLSQALSVLNGWFDKRDAMRGYRDAIQGIAQGLKDGFSREDVGNIDAAGQSILQVANLIKNPDRQESFLAGARQQLLDVARNSGPAAAAAIQKVVDKFDSQALTHPPPIKLTADDNAAEAAFARTRRSMSTLDHSTATPSVNVNPGNTFQLLGGIQSALSRIVSKTITITVRKVGAAVGGLNFDTGGYTGDGPPKEPAGIVHRGEVVLPQGVVKRDWGMLKSRYGTLPGFDSGGLVGSTYTRRRDGGDTATDTASDTGTAAPLHETAKAADRVAGALKKLESRLDKVTTSYEKQKSKLDDLISQRSSIAGSISSAAQHDPFGNGVAGLDAQVDADTNDIDAMTAALATLVKNGLDPKSALYQQLAAHMDVNTAQQLAQLSAGDLASRAERFQHRADSAGALGLSVADQAAAANGQALSVAITNATKINEKLEARLHSLEDAIHDLKDLPDKTGNAVFHGSREGTQEANDARGKAGDGGVASLVRTKPRPQVKRGGRGQR